MSNNPYSFESFVSFLSNNFGVVVIALLFAFGGFVSGSLWTENQTLKAGGSKVAAVQPSGGTDPSGDVPEGPTQGQLDQTPEITDADHIRGNRNAKVFLVEYSDFECPFCAAFHPTISQIKEEFGNDVAWVYRHFPLSFHPQAMPAAQASECVAKYGGDEAFWKFGDELFRINSENGRLTRGDLTDAIGVTGLDVATVESCIDSGEFEQYVQDAMDNGAAAGISGTPGTIVITADGPQEVISGALPYESVKTIVEKYL